MDVTKPADVDAVVRRLVEDGVSLYAVINNAGVGRGGIVDWCPMEEYRRIMEVNFFSVVSVSKACLPLLKQSKGRIINISSVAGFAAVRLKIDRGCLRVSWDECQAAPMFTIETTNQP